VCVDETQMPGATGHIVLDASHTGMLFSAQVAEATARFLRQGSFRPDAGR
jgi:hypothetical protein